MEVYICGEIYYNYTVKRGGADFLRCGEKISPQTLEQKGK